MKQAIQNTYFSNGNLIIAGEYFVLIGSKALAVPLKYGQMMRVECNKNNLNTIQWKTFELGKSWFRGDFNCENLNIISSGNMEKASWLQKVLKDIRNLKPELFIRNKSYQFTCDIHFNTNWGWGSSSTLITNLANWAGINAFELNKLVTSGSGYDIAAAGSSTPVFYRINKKSHEINPVAFDPVFKRFIYFVYLGKKQNTSTSIEINLKSVKKNQNMIPVITDLSEKIAKGENINEFVRYIVEHEKILSKTLNIPRIKEKYFNDFEGEVKSLGAWGGDFAMAVSQLTEMRVKQYFRDKGLETIFRFDEIVKSSL